MARQGRYRRPFWGERSTRHEPATPPSLPLREAGAHGAVRRSRLRGSGKGQRGNERLLHGQSEMAVKALGPSDKMHQNANLDEIRANPRSTATPWHPVLLALNPRRPLSTATGEASALAQCYPPRSQKDSDGIAQSGKSFSGPSRLSLPIAPASALGPFDVASRLPRKVGQNPLTTSFHFANRRSRIDRNRCSSFHLDPIPNRR